VEEKWRKVEQLKGGRKRKFSTTNGTCQNGKTGDLGILSLACHPGLAFYVSRFVYSTPMIGQKPQTA
jgi:hypothetical protein